MHIKPKRLRGEQKWNTCCSVDGVDLDDVMVTFEVVPPEPDVNEPGGVEITGVYYEDQGCQLADMTEQEVEWLSVQLLEHVNDYYDDYADWAYEQWKDRRYDRE